MNDHIFPYWDDDRLNQRDPGDEQQPHIPSQKSLDDRDNVELYIMSDDEANDFVEFLQSDEYIKWQEELSERENKSSDERKFYAAALERAATLSG